MLDCTVFLNAQRPDNQGVSNALGKNKALLNKLFQVIGIFSAQFFLVLSPRRIFAQMLGNLKSRNRPVLQNNLKNIPFHGRKPLQKNRICNARIMIHNE